jgi:ribonucleoside-diphosphate reductase alpha chain
MRLGIPYDSAEGRAICGAITAIMCGEAYATSAEMAAQLGAFEGFEANQESMLRVIRNHRRAAHGTLRRRVRGSQHHPHGAFRGHHALPTFCRGARGLGSRPRSRQQHGYRNAQAT